jgi:hypothetical protein
VTNKKWETFLSERLSQLMQAIEHGWVTVTCAPPHDEKPESWRIGPVNWEWALGALVALPGSWLESRLADVNDDCLYVPIAAALPALETAPPSRDDTPHGSYCAPDDPDDFDEWTRVVALHDPEHSLPKMPPPEYYGTPRWQTLGAEVRKAWDHRCGLCGRTDVGTEVHHNTYANLGNERFFDLIPLCADCHERHHRTVSRIEREVQRIFAAAKTPERV